MNKKIFFATLASALFLTPATFAGANPFADVPASHWAYDSLMKLASEGIVEGYGDGTFLGNRNITRYEMAQMIARALAKNPNQAQKAELDKLAAEFREELGSLGVRIENLEKHSDKLTWSGNVAYEYLHTHTDGGIRDSSTENHFNDFTIELYPHAEVNEHWSANAKIVSYTYLNYKDKEPDEQEQEFIMERLYAEGKYKNFTVQLGKVPILSENDHQMVMDDSASGGQITFGNKYKFTLFAGNFSGLPYQFAEFYNDREEKFNFGIGYHRIKNEGYRNISTTNNGYYDADSANIFTAGMKYHFGDFALEGNFSQNPSGKNYASTQRRAYSVELKYHEADTETPGSYELFAAYRKLGHMAVIVPTYDISIVGIKGWHFGGEYIVTKNLSAQLQYFMGERVSPRWQGKHTNKIYGKVEWSF